MSTGAVNTVLERIQDLIGSDVNTTEILTLKDLVNTGFNYVADMLPQQSEFWRIASLPNYDSVAAINAADLSSSDYKVISITREDSSGIPRMCMEVSFSDYQKGQDNTSIFYNQKNFKNPMYTFDETGDLIISPTGGTVKIYYYKYLTTDTILDDETLNDIADTYFFPQQAVFAGILKSCLNILQVKISQAVQDEEDQELLGLLGTQSASIEKLFGTELQRLNIPAQMLGDTQ